MMALSAGLALAIGTGSWGLGAVVGLAILAAGRRPLPGVNLLSGVAVVAAAMATWAGASLEDVLAAGLAWFVVHQRSTSKRPATDVLLVGLLLVVCATQTRSPLFAAAFGAWVVGLGPTLGTPSWVALPVACVALPIFLFTPRFVPSDLRERDARGLTGFSADVELGAMSDLLDDPSRVFTVTFSTPIDAPPYFRGVALDRFDGRRWWTDARRTREPRYDGSLADAVRIDVALEAHPESMLFIPGTPDGVDADGLAVERDAGGAYHLPGPPRAIDYTAWVRPPFGPGRSDPFLDAEPRTDLPPMSPEVQALFADVVADRTEPRAKMDALATWLRTTYTYTRAPRDLDAEAPLDRFLLDTRQGHCEYFASALAVAGRLSGVPTRLVNGFVGGDVVSDTQLVVRRYHAHSWVEYFDGGQWVTLDATPPASVPTGPGSWTTLTESVDAWWQDLVGFDGEQQIAAAQGLSARVLPDASPRTSVLFGAVVLGLLTGTAMLLLGRVVRRATDPQPPSPRLDPVTSTLVEARELLVERGWSTPAHLPDVAFAEWVATRDQAAGSVLLELAWLSYAVRFGGDAVDAHLPRARELGAALRDLA